MSWTKVCELHQLTPGTGVAALVGGQQVALFYVPEQAPGLFALDNWDPCGQAFVLSRGLIADLQGEAWVASPLYKQHFNLSDGRCLEEAGTAVRSWPVRLEGTSVYIAPPAE